jgi:hypothetical protein
MMGITLLSIKEKIIIPPKKREKKKTYKGRCDFLFLFSPQFCDIEKLVSFFSPKNQHK